MGRTISIVNTLTVAAGSSGTVSVYKPTAGKKAVLRKATFWFPAGSENKLLVAVMHGINRVCPKEGYASGDDSMVIAECEWEYQSDEEVKLYYNNTDTVNSHTVTYTLVLEIG